jgi:proteasome lid subunit RPN8/RPN11
MISLLREHLKQICEHGQRDYPHECCGLMLGKFVGNGDKTVSEIYPISNAREEEHKRNRFLIRPEEFLHGERYANELELDVVGFYHSHPDCEAKPSAYDLDHAWPTYSYIIVSVSGACAADLRSWSLEADRSRFNPEEISELCKEVQHVNCSVLGKEFSNASDHQNPHCSSTIC